MKTERMATGCTLEFVGEIRQIDKTNCIWRRIYSFIVNDHNINPVDEFILWSFFIAQEIAVGKEMIIFAVVSQSCN